MSDSIDRHPLEQLAEAFLERFRRGERPSLTEYTTQYPELESEIRDLFPTLIAMEEFGPSDGELRGQISSAVASCGPLPPQIGEYRILREIGRGGMGIV